MVVQRAVDATTASLRRAILDGTYPAGSALPPERRLCVELGVSRLTLRAAVARLEGEHLLTARRGSGVTVLALREHAAVDVLAHVAIAEDSPDTHRALLESFLVLRRRLLADVMAMAAPRATPVQVRELRTLANFASERTLLDQGDRRFVRALVRLTGNAALDLLISSFQRVIDAHEELSWAWHVDDGRIVRAHPQLAGLLEAGGGAEVVRAEVLTRWERLDRGIVETIRRRMHSPLLFEG